jgi:predicted NUDIX family phosphoesterase
MPTDERVLVIPTAHFEAVGYFHGLRPSDANYRAALLDARLFSFRPRSEVETDPAFKQLIPYVVLRHGDRLFQYRRGASGTEKRLRALRSVGIGGHISEQDAAGPGDWYANGMRREVTEEVTIGCQYSEQLLGFINDDRTPVGRVHLGVVHLWGLEAPAVRSNEDALAEGGFVPLDQLRAEREQFETWSQFVLELLHAGK